jgi:hypothetical protein
LYQETSTWKNRDQIQHCQVCGAGCFWFENNIAKCAGCFPLEGMPHRAIDLPTRSGKAGQTETIPAIQSDGSENIVSQMVVSCEISEVVDSETNDSSAFNC